MPTDSTKETFVNGYETVDVDIPLFTGFCSWVHTGDEVIITRDREVFVYDRLKVFDTTLFRIIDNELE